MSNTLDEALTASRQQRALYDDGQRRAFVSQRNVNFDLAITSQSGKVVRLNQTSAMLRDVLDAHGIPRDSGWKPL